jgi:NAD(P)-dependent dehydrogenase (short-subunit alcohol dehydrogenase family)
MERRKVALVTGANRGIGKELCRQLAKEGYTVILTSRSTEQGLAAAQDLAIVSDNIFVHQLDVADQQSVDALSDFVDREFGRLDILINNAGINYDTWNRAETADLVECHQTMEVNLFGAWRMAQAFLPLMRKQRYGRIVNVSSGAGAITGMGGGTPAYSISKAALNVLTIKLASEVAGTGILVNAVCPGWVRTDMGGQAAPRSVAEGARSVLWAAYLPDNGPNGGFFRDGLAIAW